MEDMNVDDETQEESMTQDGARTSSATLPSSSIAPPAPLAGPSGTAASSQVDPAAQAAADRARAEARFGIFRKRLGEAFKTTFRDEDQMFLDDLLPEINRNLPIDDVFTATEAKEILQRLHDQPENAILMWVDGIIVSFHPRVL